VPCVNAGTCADVIDEDVHVLACAHGAHMACMLACIRVPYDIVQELL
jgi:NAD/NADP transhydrogenase beta subunit